MQNINQMLDPEKTPHTSPLRASYGLSFVNICEKIDGIITAPHCNLLHHSGAHCTVDPPNYAVALIDTLVRYQLIITLTS